MLPLLRSIVQTNIYSSHVSYFCHRSKHRTAPFLLHNSIHSSSSPGWDSCPVRLLISIIILDDVEDLKSWFRTCSRCIKFKRYIRGLSICQISLVYQEHCSSYLPFFSNPGNASCRWYKCVAIHIQRQARTEPAFKPITEYAARDL